MSYHTLHLDAKTAIARTSIAAWNALMRADPVFGRYALSDIGRADFLTAFTVISDRKWTLNGKLHRVDTPGIPGSAGPAITYDNGAEEWYERGVRHRIGGPACIHADSGVESWFEHGVSHRVGGPAVTYGYGRMEWYERGQLHRVGGPAIVYPDGSEEWYERDQLHRIGGPAHTWADGSEVWYERGQLHRIGGPACTFVGGDVSWWEHGVRIERDPPM